MNDDFRIMFENLSKYGIVRHDEDKPLYKFVSIETAKIIISTGTIKFSTPKELNDNDLHSLFLNPSVSEENKNRITLDLIRKHDLYPNLKQYLDGEKGLSKLNEVFSLEVFNNAIITSYEEQRQNIGIFCLTSDNSNVYMWNKYADNSKGVCLQFNFPHLFTKLFYTFTVAYNLELNSGMIFNEDTSVNSLTINRWFFTKSKRYEIEKEVRMVSDKNIGICPFPRKYLTGIQYGKNIATKDFNEIEKLLRQANYSTTSPTSQL